LDDVNAVRANDIAGNFFRQSFRIFNIKNTTLRNGVWFVTASVTSFGTERNQTVQIEAKTGIIMAYE